jgi:hypothetical protein
MPLLVCRTCGADPCECHQSECVSHKATIAERGKARNPSEKSPNSALSAERGLISSSVLPSNVMSFGEARLNRAKDALRSATKEISRQRLIADYKRKGLCQSGRTRIAHRDAMKIYMRRYRKRKREEAALKASQAQAQPQVGA